MGSACAEQHKFHPSQQLLLLNKKSLLRDIDIPPRKLLGRRSSTSSSSGSSSSAFSPESLEMFSDSPTKADEALLQRFLPYNKDDDDDDADPYSSDHFRMFEFKVRKCTRSRSHDWTDCPFAHPGEKARRRDPRRFHYSGTVCSEFRRGGCSRGDNCEFAHGVFECWLHPARYRTEACKDGKNCKRKVCFFAHTPRQLRLLPANAAYDGSASSPVNSPASNPDRKYRNSTAHCCIHCHSLIASPTSTLLDMSHLSPPVSPSLSPPLSPVKRFSPISRFGDRLNQFNPGGLSYKDALTELMSSMEAMSVTEAAAAASPTPPRTNDQRKSFSWANVNFNGCDAADQTLNQTQFVLSPSTPSCSSGYRDFLVADSSRKSFIDDKHSEACPDLGWVNDLLT